ncbi:uncharacterized protein P884DRAFT_12945 [Thermothelomyces heterothallicus CBS 202.75]|uniref:uncharacterized protein n=1 Tax=Thermothelomyces heterothallicus CBS 202.75 TaxID=1149848 RepID=UPI003743266F
MTSPEGNTVTIGREYFNTLLRRAEYNSKPLEPTGNFASVVVSRAEYDNLVLIARQYGNLRRNLLRGGVGEETVDLLSQDDETIRRAPTSAVTLQADPNEDGGARLDSPTPDPSAAYAQQKDTQHSPRHGRSAWADSDVDEADNDDENGASEAGSRPEDRPGARYTKLQGQRPQFERQCARTLQLSNLAEGTTHADIVNAVRGGMLLDIFLRSHDRSATVSFLNSEDAKKFYEHVRRHDLYIRNKRVEVKWNDRQFILQGHVANKISMGASRNLVIQGYDNRHTEDVIRGDLDHIHTLVVVKIEFVGSSCYIGLNSVHNAIYARQCMLTRLRYKGKKISFDVDECAQPYPQPAPKPRKEVAPPRKKLARVPNRFQLLNPDDGDDEIAATLGTKNAVGITA